MRAAGHGGHKPGRCASALLLSNARCGVYNGQPDRKSQVRIRNKPDLFGRQILVDADDVPLGEEERLLLAASAMSISEIAEAAWDLGGVMVPAHINKGANSLLPVLGLMPADVALPAVEIVQTMPHCVRGKLCIHASDAHRLVDIREAEEACMLELPELSPDAIIAVLRRGKEEV